MKHSEITDKIIHSFYEVYNSLGYGFLEKVYENAMILELRKHDLSVENQVAIKVHYDGTVLGTYYADILVDDLVIVELKATREIHKEHEAQLLNYLTATDKEVGLLLNFGVEAKFSRKFYENKFKRLSLISIVDTEMENP